MAALETITDADFEAQVIRSACPVVVDFWAPWCPPCLALAPGLERLAHEFAGRLRIVKANVDEARPVVAAYEIQMIPTLVLFRDGQEWDRLPGDLPLGELRAAFELLAGGAPPRSSTWSRREESGHEEAR
jgi:thioredoxin 1